MDVLSGVSVNDQVLDGNYMCDDTCTDLPPQQSAGVLEVLSAPGHMIYQRFTGLAFYGDKYLSKYERFIYTDENPGAINLTWQKTN